MLDNNETELIESFYRDLEFGTGGLRGIMGVGTNRMNIYTLGMATQGLCNYLLDQFSDRKEISVAVAHDCRNNSPLFAEITAQICIANGIKAYLFDGLRPTPELSFAIRQLGCQSGVVITASHNPKEYNGYKAYWEDGGQIINPHDVNIINEVKKIKSIGDVKFDGDKEKIITLGEEMDKLYLDEVVRQSINPELIAANPDIKIVYTPIHGTGVKLVPRALKLMGFTSIYNVPEQDVVDGNFPTVISPNPEESAALDMALKKADEVGAMALIYRSYFAFSKNPRINSKGLNGQGATRLVLQGDSNLVLHTAANAPVWSSNTVGSGATELRLNDDGTLALYQGTSAVWSEPSNNNSDGKVQSAQGYRVADR